MSKWKHWKTLPNPGLHCRLFCIGNGNCNLFDGISTKFLWLPLWSGLWLWKLAIEKDAIFSGAFLFFLYSNLVIWKKNWVVLVGKQWITHFAIYLNGCAFSFIFFVFQNSKSNLFLFLLEVGTICKKQFFKTNYTSLWFALLEFADCSLEI